VVDRYFSPSARHEVERSAGGSAPRGIPQFLVDLESWPYIAGVEFMVSLVRKKGFGAANDALRHLPVSTSQVMHPESYPGAQPAPLDIPQHTTHLGAARRDPDRGEIGDRRYDNRQRIRAGPPGPEPAAPGRPGRALR